MSPRAAGANTRWRILTVSLLAQMFTSMLQFGMPFLLPQLENFSAGSVSLAATLISAPSVGLIMTLFGWGWFADRFGELLTMTLGLISGSVVLAVLVLALSASPSFLVVWGLLCLSSGLLAAVNSASGRLILGWFPLRERGLAMGVRQTGQPLGVALSAGIFPVTATLFGLQAPFIIVTAGCTVAAVLILLIVPSEPPAEYAVTTTTTSSSSSSSSSSTVRIQRTDSPYAHSRIWRVHGASALLTVSQFIFSVFGFTFLITDMGWHPVAAGLFFTVANFVSAAMRVVLGWLSDRLASRLKFLRWISYALTGLTLTLVALHQVSPQSEELPGITTAIIAALFVATAISSSNNGLSYTLVAEYAGTPWVGRALGTQNTLQNLVAVVLPPLGAIVLTTSGFSTLLIVGALSAGAAALTLPSTEQTPPKPKQAT